MANETSVALLNCIEKIYDLFLQNEKTRQLRQVLHR